MNLLTNEAIEDLLDSFQEAAVNYEVAEGHEEVGAAMLYLDHTRSELFKAIDAQGALVDALAGYVVLGSGKCSIGKATVDTALEALAKAGAL